MPAAHASFVEGVGQYQPLGHGCSAADPSGQYEPLLHSALDVELVQKWPSGQAPSCVASDGVRSAGQYAPAAVQFRSSNGVGQ